MSALPLRKARPGTLHQSRLRTFPCALLAGLFAVLLFPLMSSADELVFCNGDRLEGEMVRADKEKVFFKSTMAGEVGVLWANVATLTVDATLVFTTEEDEPIRGLPRLSGGVWSVTREDESVTVIPIHTAVAVRTVDGQEAFEKEQARREHPKFSDFWQGSADAGLSVTQGDTETLTLSGGVRSARTTAIDRFSLYGALLFAQNNTAGVTLTAANVARGGMRYDRNFEKYFFGFGFTDQAFDEFKGLDLRSVYGGGLGWNVVQGKRDRFALFSGVSYNRENFSTGLQRSAGEWLFGEELTVRFSSAVDFTERIAVFANLNNTGEYRGNLDASLTTRFSKKFSWHITFSDRYISNPAVGFAWNNFLFTTGLRVSFGKPPGRKFKARVDGVLKK